MKKKEKIYLVRNTDEPECPFWEQFESLKDAVATHEGADIFVAEPKFIGKFELKTEIKKRKERKMKKKTVAKKKTAKKTARKTKK